MSAECKHARRQPLNMPHIISCSAAMELGPLYSDMQAFRDTRQISTVGSTRHLLRSVHDIANLSRNGILLGLPLTSAE